MSGFKDISTTVAKQLVFDVFFKENKREEDVKGILLGIPATSPKSIHRDQHTHTLTHSKLASLSRLLVFVLGAIDPGGVDFYFGFLSARRRPLPLRRLPRSRRLPYPPTIHHGQALQEMPCALEVTDTRLKCTSHMQCCRSVDRNIDKHFSEDQLIHGPVSLLPENRNSTFTVLSLGHNSDWKLVPFSSSIQEVNKTSCLTSGVTGIQGLELFSPQPKVVYLLGQPNEKNMHDQEDSSKQPPNGGSALRQYRHRKKFKNSLATYPPGHVVANNSSRPVTAPLRSDSNILNDDDKPPKRTSKKKGNRKWKQHRQAMLEKLNLLPEFLCEEHTDAASPVEVLLTDILADKLSDNSSSASSLVKDVHLGKDNSNINIEYVEHGTMLNLSTLGSDGRHGSECAGSSNETVGERPNCNRAPYLNDGPKTADSSEFGGSAVTERLYSYVTEENSSCQRSFCACNSNDATTVPLFNKWSSDNSRDCSIGVEGSLIIKDENIHDGLERGASTGLDNMKKVCHLTGSHLSGTHAGDSNDSLVSSSCCSKDVNDNSIHTERVQCSSEACSSKTFLPVSSGRSGRRSRKTSSCGNLSATNRGVGANRHMHSGKDNSVSVWQKVEKFNKENTTREGRVVASALQDNSALEDTNNGAHNEPTRPMAKRNQCRKSCKQHSPDETVEMGPTKECDSLNSCRTFSRCIYKKQTPFLYQQTSLSSKNGSSQSLRNYYAPKNGIPKAPKNHSQHIEGLPMLQLVCARDIIDRSADEFSPTGIVSNSPTGGNGSSQSGAEKAALVACNLDCHLVSQATSEETCTLILQDDAHSLCLENESISTDLDSMNLCTDPCAVEMEETECVKLTTEKTQESCKLYSADGHMSQKWVPVGKNDSIHLNVPEAFAAEASVPPNDISSSANIEMESNVSDVPVSTSGEDSKVATEVTAKSNSSGKLDSKCQAHIESGIAISKIREAVSDAYRAQQRVEDIQLLIGRPLADFEKFIYSASPILQYSPCPMGCNSCSRECITDGLCVHQTVDISLRSIWQWYEEAGCYGLEVNAQDLRRSKGLRNSHYQFNTYFVPYLSAVQLFGQSKRANAGTIYKEAANMDVRFKAYPCLDSLSILAKLLPQQSDQRNSPPALRIKDDQRLESVELIFEFFESEQPFWRRQLFDKVKELVSGAKQSNCQISGDPRNLELNLHDLHPASWYCVAWYPIYRIPDGKFQAAFLTYHSLGHWVHRRSSADHQAGDTHVVLPVMGLQSYNDKAEGWFEMSISGGEDIKSLSSGASEVVQERLLTLNKAAAAMARADVLKKDQMRRNRHPDYEFFLSRYR